METSNIQQINKQQQEQQQLDPQTMERIQAKLNELYDKPQYQQHQRQRGSRGGKPFIKLSHDMEAKRLYFTGTFEEEQMPAKGFNSYFNFKYEIFQMAVQDQPFGRLIKIKSHTSITNPYYDASTQYQVTTRLTDSTIKALVNSILTLIDSNNGIQNPISLESIKSYLVQRHNLSNPSDVETVIAAFKQAYPQIKIATLEEAIQELYKDQTTINTIVRELLNNELASDSTYTSDDLVKIIKQKFPSVSDAIITGVLDSLAAQITKVASITKGAYHNPVTYWQNRKYHNPIDAFDRNSFLYRRKLLGNR
jgi:hypothetical protein